MRRCVLVLGVGPGLCEVSAGRNAPLECVVALMNALADATIDFMISDPANADEHRLTASAAMWRILA